MQPQESSIAKKRPTNYMYRGKTPLTVREQNSKIKHNLMETVLKGTNLINDPAFMEEVLPFYDPKHFQSEYTLEVYFQIMDRACDWLHPNLSRAEGREQIGKVLFNGFQKTVMGKILLASLHLMTPEKILLTAVHIFNNILLYGKRSSKELGPKSYLLSTRDTFGTPEEQVGALLACLEFAGTKNPRCTIKILESGSWDYIFEWD